MPNFLIEKLWTDTLENRIPSAMGYNPFCVTDSKAKAESICSDAGVMVGDGWPIRKGETMPNMRWTEMPNA